MGYDLELVEAIKARIVKRVGNRREWEDWAEDVGQICQEQIDHIQRVLDQPENGSSRQALENFTQELRATLNGDLSKGEIIDMLGQHIVTKPIMDALFNKYDFMDSNPISKAMTKMLDALDKDGMKTAKKLLETFYQAVKFRVQNIKTPEERQTVVIELFDKFFKNAFPKQQDKFGIVYTPVQIVDFIIQSVSDVLKSEFNLSMADEGVHILDPFTGTGTFITRLMESGIIPKEKLSYKYENELHAQEIVPLAYYVASMNIEAAYHDLVPSSNYAPNKVMVWTDTFADHGAEDCFRTSLSENNDRLVELNRKDIRVIIGNPPYSVGQESQNDDNQNEHYEKLDQRLADTYVARTNSTLKGKLYDSYIRAYRWASDRIGEKGIIGFVTSAGWLESNSADGMRKCMTEEFSSIYIYHLKGNQRTSGERSRQEGGKIFGGGSRSPVAIVILVKNPVSKQRGKIYFHAIDDYLTREEKLAEVAKVKTITALTFQEIVPDSHGDWLNIRDDSFKSFMRMGGKNTDEPAIFSNFSLGVNSARDFWAYSSSKDKLVRNMGNCIDFYNSEVDRASLLMQEQEEFIANLDPKMMKWDRPQKKGVLKNKKSEKVDPEKIVSSMYRPFVGQWLYFDRFWNNCVYQMPKLFPKRNSANLVIAVASGSSSFSCLMVNRISCYDFIEKAQCFPRYLYEEQAKKGHLKSSIADLFEVDSDVAEFKRVDAITPEGIDYFEKAYPNQKITADDVFYYIYGILHSEDYRKKYANNLMRELPRIPRVKTYSQFELFRNAGKKLADLHVHFDKVETYKGVKIVKKQGTVSYKVDKMKWAKISGKKGNSLESFDKTKLIYNEDIVIENIPLEAQKFIVNKKSALDWIVEFASVRVDKDKKNKPGSHIVNNFNDYAAEIGNFAYPLDLFLRVITISLETVKIVNDLPSLEIHDLDTSLS